MLCSKAIFGMVGAKFEFIITFNHTETPSKCYDTQPLSLLI